MIGWTQSLALARSCAEVMLMALAAFAIFKAAEGGFSKCDIAEDLVIETFVLQSSDVIQVLAT